MITLVIAEDHALVREGIRALLERDPEVQVIGEAANGLEALDRVIELAPDVLLVDLAMPNLNGLEVLTRMQTLRSKTRVIVVSMHAEEGLIIQALRNGAKSYLLKDFFKDELFTAIHTVARGDTYLSPKFAGPVLQDLLEERFKNVPLNPLDRLSERERQVMQLIVEGSTNRQIAETLHISPKTVDKHRMSLMRKLDVHDVTGLMHVAMQSGLLYVR